jgi:hypothetical protein
MIYNKLFRTRIVRAGLLLFLATILLAAVKPLLARQLERAVLAVARQTVMPDVLLAAGWNLASIPNAPDNSDHTAV